MPILPLFPLHLVVFPGEKLRLHIFEPRYKQLIQDCHEQGITFGIPSVISKKVHDIATEVKLVEIDHQYPGGEMDITTQGIRRIEIQDFSKQMTDKLYPGAQINPYEDLTENAPPVDKKEILNSLRLLYSILQIDKKLVEKADELKAFDIAHHLGFNLRQEYKLLTLQSENERLLYIKEHLEHVLPILSETEELKVKAKLNGHHRNIIPPEEFNL